MANQVLDTPGMTNALKAVLDAPPPPLPAGGAAAEGPFGKSISKGALAAFGCRLGLLARCPVGMEQRLQT